jgi:hypothetical protein
MKNKIKRLLINLSPSIFGSIFAVRSRRVAEKARQERDSEEKSRLLVKEYGQIVRNGPFAGMKLPEIVQERHVGPFLFGAYESTLHPAVQSVARNSYDSIVDVGSAWGYYAVGFARMFPDSVVYAYDLDPEARKQVLETAKLNDQENIQVGSACVPGELRKRIGNRSLVFSDCEGYEETLFDSETVAALENSDVIIELHPIGGDKIRRTLKGRFNTSHEVSIFDAEPVEDKRHFLPEGVSEVAVKEVGRGVGQQWLVAKAQ